MFAIQNFSTKQRRNLMFLWLKIHNFKSCKLFLLYFFFFGPRNYKPRNPYFCSNREIKMPRNL